VTDLALADEGRLRIEWADRHMPVLRDIRARFENLYDVSIGKPGVLTSLGGLSFQGTLIDDTQLEVILRAVEKSDRSTVVIAVGGGVIGDMVGFAAATYLRGIPVVHVPTTLLAQVDSAIGGKTGVNHPLGKNLIGAFHPPSLVVADPVVLETLPRREFRAGLYEVIKYGVISEPTLLDRMRDTMPAIFAREGDAIAPLVSASCRIKAQVVSADEREAGLRRILNFGHTVGHALEAVTKYKQFRHGEAIGYGMLAALAIGVARGVTPKALYDEVEALITQLGPLPPVADISAKEVYAAIGRDKKVVAGTLHFVAATERGKTIELTDVTEKEIKAAAKKIGLRA